VDPAIARPVDNRPPALTGLSKGALCFQQRSGARSSTWLDTSIIGVGTAARIRQSNLRLGFVNRKHPADPDTLQGAQQS